VHALSNDHIKGLEYAIRGENSITYDGILNVLAKHTENIHWEKCKRSVIAGWLEKFFVGETHDKNLVIILIY
jgi:hypothetical protein